MDLPIGDAGSTMRLIVPWVDMHNNDSDMPVCHGCLHINILPLRLLCSECKENRTEALVKYPPR
jgi:hypothetical protein